MWLTAQYWLWAVCVNVGAYLIKGILSLYRRFTVPTYLYNGIQRKAFREQCASLCSLQTNIELFVSSTQPERHPCKGWRGLDDEDGDKTDFSAYFWYSLGNDVKIENNCVDVYCTLQFFTGNVYVELNWNILNWIKIWWNGVELHQMKLGKFNWSDLSWTELKL